MALSAATLGANSSTAVRSTASAVGSMVVVMLFPFQRGTRSAPPFAQRRGPTCQAYVRAIARRHRP